MKFQVMKEELLVICKEVYYGEIIPNFVLTVRQVGQDS